MRATIPLLAILMLACAAFAAGGAAYQVPGTAAISGGAAANGSAPRVPDTGPATVRNATLFLPNISAASIAAAMECDDSNTIIPDLKHYPCQHTDVEEPAYLGELAGECDALYRDAEITADLNARLGELGAVEAYANASEAAAADFYARGQAALGCIRLNPKEYHFAQIETSGGGPASPTGSLPGTYGMDAAADLGRFHHAYGESRFGWECANSTLGLMRNLTAGLEESCRNRSCTYWYLRENSARALGEWHNLTLGYANATRQAASRARDASAGYHAAKAKINVSRCFPLSGPRASVSSAAGINHSRLLPPRASARVAGKVIGITNTTAPNGPRSSYEVRSMVSGNLLWLIPAEMEVVIEVDEDGAVVREEKPWWGFLLFG